VNAAEGGARRTVALQLAIRDMKIVVLTIFPEMFTPFWETGIIRRAIAHGVISVETLNVRDFAEGRHKSTDDRPYGGGCGMVMKPEPLASAIRAAREMAPDARVVLMSPQGKTFDQAAAGALARGPGMIVICGRYEGIDERIAESFVDLEFSVGDFVLTGGELPAMMVIDAVSRLLPDALGDESSAENDSFFSGSLDHPHYTRPRVFEGSPVPEVLLSGNHRDIADWRLEEGMMRTVLRRPDLLMNRDLSPRETGILKKWNAEIERVLRGKPLSGADSLSGAQQEG